MAAVTVCSYFQVQENKKKNCEQSKMLFQAAGFGDHASCDNSNWNRIQSFMRTVWKALDGM